MQCTPVGVKVNCNQISVWLDLGFFKCKKNKMFVERNKSALFYFSPFVKMYFLMLYVDHLYELLVINFR